MMLYCKYRKFIKIFKTIQNANDLYHLDWKLEEKYGKNAQEAFSILRAKGGINQYNLYNENKNTANIDTIILEYEDKCSSMLWGFLKWTIGTLIAIAGLIIAYLSFVK